MRYLEPTDPVLAVPVSTADAKEAKFVVTQIARVENPRRVPLQFRVSFKPSTGAEVVLGTFSLYPADRPGRFIVATQGKVRPGGQILLTIDAEDEELRDVRVGVAALALGPE